jgi:regulator of replication initiation timing
MSDWKYEINDGLVAFYENGIERNIDKVFDTLNAAEARIAELEEENIRLGIEYQRMRGA